MTNTYQADVNLYAQHLDMTREQGYNLIKESVELAKTAIKRYAEEFPFSSKKRLVLIAVQFKHSILQDSP